MDNDQAKRLNQNLEQIDENLKHLVRAVDDLISVQMTAEGDSPRQNHRV